MSKLSQEDFLRALELVPLVSFDFIIQHPDKGPSGEERKFLVGLRKNEPAKGSFFVPGGCIIKGEKLDEAFSRISKAELGTEIRRQSAAYLGLYEHFYETNFAGKEGVSTHYIIHAYYFTLAPGEELSIAADDQHTEFRWISFKEARESPQVHANTRAYFRGQKLLQSLQPLQHWSR